jgi:hypothetical protein
MQEGQEPIRFTMPHGLAELQAALEQTWPAHIAALRASGVPLNEGEETDEEKEARLAAEAASKKKPWGADADFDPDKAWKLITNLRTDVEKVKQERDQLKQKVLEHENASKTEQEKSAERAATAEKDAADAKRDASRLRIAVKKGLTETQAKRLVGDTEEELEADADELVASFKSDDDGGEKPTTKTRPKENLRTGAAPSSEAEETDPEKLAAMVPRRY